MSEQSTSQPIRLNGGQALILSLEMEGVEVVFGYPGGAILPVYDPIIDSKIRHVLVRHEQGAVHAADGYARAGDRVGVCLVTSGPGATNAVTGLTDALLDSIPVVCITGQVPTHLIGSDAFLDPSHFLPAGKPAPPLPLRLDFLTSSRTSTSSTGTSPTMS